MLSRTSVPVLCSRWQGGDQPQAGLNPGGLFQAQGLRDCHTVPSALGIATPQSLCTTASEQQEAISSSSFLPSFSLSLPSPGSQGVSAQRGSLLAELCSPSQREFLGIHSCGLPAESPALPQSPHSEPKVTLLGENQESLETQLLF